MAGNATADPAGRAPDAIARFRARYHEQHTSPRYRGWLHFAGMVALSVTIIAACLVALEEVRPLEWLTIPVAFVYANLVEYLGHRFPMHHRWRGLGLIFERHSVQHHRFFTHRWMAFDDSRDFKAVLFPLSLIAFYFALIGVPTFLLVAWLFSKNVALLFIATAVAYYFNYELLHFAYHTRPDAPIARLPGFSRLRKLHTSHHDPRLMLTHNFNITYPIGDWLFGTLWRGESEATPRPRSSRSADSTP